MQLISAAFKSSLIDSYFEREREKSYTWTTMPLPLVEVEVEEEEELQVITEAISSIMAHKGRAMMPFSFHRMAVHARQHDDVKYNMDFACPIHGDDDDDVGGRCS